MKFDYIIIGAGTAGCVLANRLSINPDTSVLLLEAGDKDKKTEIHIPLGTSKLYHSEVDWDQVPEPMPHANNRQIFYPRGKVLGGSSSINTMIYIRGHKKDYDLWESLGNKGWSYEEVLPYFKKSENYHKGENDYHGSEGELRIEPTNARYENELWGVFKKAASSIGLVENDDFNGAVQEGLGWYDTTIKKGVRQSTATSFLKPIKNRKNLSVFTNAYVQKIEIEEGKATGVTFIYNDQKQTAHVNKEVILSAGAINSPQVMMLSGVGDKEELTKHGIDIKHELKGVGKNLKDHPFFPICYTVKKKVSLNSQLSGLKSFTQTLNYLINKRGPLASITAACGGFLTINDNAEHPDMQLHFAPVWGDKIDVPFEEIPKVDGFTLLPTMLRPQSTGHIGLKSSNPADQPAIHLNYFEKEEDLELMMKAYKIGIKLLEAPSFAPYIDKVARPGKPLLTDNEIKDYLRENVETCYHPVGTCKMGNDELAVVDDNLRVHGIGQLRVVDASIMPTITSGNTNAPTIMIAEKAADMILAEK